MNKQTTIKHTAPASEIANRVPTRLAIYSDLYYNGMNFKPELKEEPYRSCTMIPVLAPEISYQQQHYCDGISHDCLPVTEFHRSNFQRTIRVRKRSVARRNNIYDDDSNRLQELDTLFGHVHDDKNDDESDTSATTISTDHSEITSHHNSSIFGSLSSIDELYLDDASSTSSETCIY